MFGTMRSRRSLVTTTLLLLGMLAAFGTVTIPVFVPGIGIKKSEEEILKMREEIERRKALGSYGGRRKPSP